MIQSFSSPSEEWQGRDFEAGLLTNSRNADPTLRTFPSTVDVAYSPRISLPFQLRGSGGIAPLFRSPLAHRGLSKYCWEMSRSVEYL
jgi:hypothetical protein